jgi:hypothetical protein
MAKKDPYTRKSSREGRFDIMLIYLTAQGAAYAWHTKIPFLTSQDQIKGILIQ